MALRIYAIAIELLGEPWPLLRVLPVPDELPRVLVMRSAELQRVFTMEARCDMQATWSLVGWRR